MPLVCRAQTVKHGHPCLQASRCHEWLPLRLCAHLFTGNILFIYFGCKGRKLGGKQEPEFVSAATCAAQRWPGPSGLPPSLPSSDSRILPMSPPPSKEQ